MRQGECAAAITRKIIAPDMSVPQNPVRLVGECRP
jgi:hypothetical protein